MGIDAFHVLLCGILPILVILSAVSEGVNVGGTIGLPLPCARQSDRRMQLFRAAVEGTNVGDLRRVFQSASYSICVVDAPVVFCPGILGFGTLGVKRCLHKRGGVPGLRG